MRPSLLAAVLASSAASLAPAQHLLVADSLTRDVMLLDPHDGRVLSESYFNLETLAGAQAALEVSQVGNELWASPRFERRLYRFSLAGDAFLGTIETTFSTPLLGMTGFAAVGSTAYVSCQQVLEHGGGANWVSRLGADAQGQGIFDLPNDSRASDLAFDPLTGGLLSANTTQDSIDVVTVSGVLLQRVPMVDIAAAQQVTRLADGGFALGTHLGLQLYAEDGAYLGRPFDTTSVFGVAELGTGELLLTTFDGILAYDLETSSTRLLHETTAARHVGTIDDPFLCPADLNADTSVDSGDLAILLAFWGRVDAGDIDGDGDVNSADLAIMLASWGDCR